MPKREVQIRNLSDARYARTLSAEVLAATGAYYVCFERYRPTRSLNQNSYYHAVVKMHLWAFLRDGSGDDWTEDDAHEFAKMTWLPVKERIMPNGEVRKVPTSTTELDTGEFAHFTDQICLWLGESGVHVPTPQEYFDANKKDATED